MLNKILTGIIVVLVASGLLLRPTSMYDISIGDTYYVFSLKTVVFYSAYLGMLFLLGRMVIHRLRSH